jgi:ABC-type antimicrobial peptide transport system permease subunit
MGFTFLSVLVGAIGVYGLINYETGQRRTEFAIRIAVGATRAAILRRVFKRSLILCGIGCVVGVLISLGLSRVVASLLFGVSQYSPQVYASAFLILLAVTALAVFIPSWRAASVDPISILHND